MLISMVGAKAYAYDAKVGNIYYNFSGSEAEVTHIYSPETTLFYNSDHYTGNVVIPPSVTYDNKTYSVTSIGNYAFVCCTSLTGVTIPNTVSEIGIGAFMGCIGLTSITIPNKVTSIRDLTFKECGFINVTIPSSVTNIGNESFTRCTDLTSITIPNSVTSIGYNAFQGCSSLSSINIPNSITTIESGTFTSCSSLTSVTIPNSVTSIGGEAFFGCISLPNITIPSSVTSIAGGAFSNCTDLEIIKVEQGNTKYDSRNNCNAIIETGSNTLITGCKTTIIPNTVTSIGGIAFYGCTSLTNISIPNSVSSIGYTAFRGCSGLTSITLPNSVTTIEYDAFYDCIGLTNVTFSNGVTSIGNYAFYGCKGLTNITIPSSINSIGNCAFHQCTNLTNITIEKNNPITLTGNLVSKPSNVTLYVPKGSIELYQNANYWSNFTDMREFAPSSVSITMATSSGAARSMIGYSSQYGLDFTGINDVKAYAAVAFTKGYVTYLSRIYVVPPYTGVVLRTETPGITVDVPTTDEDVYMANLLQPAVSNTTINPTETIEGVEYGNLMVGKISGTETMGFVKFNSPVVRSNNCYLRVPIDFYNALASAPQQNSLTFVFDDDETTDIRSVDALESLVDDKVYDLQGRLVTTAKKGLVIKNGKLFFVKP